MTNFAQIILIGFTLWATPALAANTWETTDWGEYMDFVESLAQMADEELADVTSSPPVIYGFLLAAGELLDGIALSTEYADYHINVRRHANRCAYRYLSDRVTYAHAPGHTAMDWPYGGLIFAAQEAFDECLVINLENAASSEEARTEFLTYVPPAKE